MQQRVLSVEDDGHEWRFVGIEVEVVAVDAVVLAEQHDEWAVVRRYMSAESLAKAAYTSSIADAEEVIDTALAEVS